MSNKEYKLVQGLRLADLTLFTPVALRAVSQRQHPLVRFGAVVAVALGAAYTLEQFERARVENE